MNIEILIIEFRGIFKKNCKEPNNGNRLISKNVSPSREIKSRNGDQPLC